MKRALGYALLALALGGCGTKPEGRLIQVYARRAQHEVDPNTFLLRSREGEVMTICLESGRVRRAVIVTNGVDTISYVWCPGEDERCGVSEERLNLARKLVNSTAMDWTSARYQSEVRAFMAQSPEQANTEGESCDAHSSSKN